MVVAMCSEFICIHPLLSTNANSANTAGMYYILLTYQIIFFTPRSFVPRAATMRFLNFYWVISDCASVCGICLKILSVRCATRNVSVAIVHL